MTYDYLVSTLINKGGEDNMYGTIFKMSPKPGAEEEVIKIFREWEDQVKPNVKGVVTGYLYKLDRGGMMGVAVFENKEAYMANADNPIQNQWFKKLRENLAEDPEWNDGEVI